MSDNDFKYLTEKFGSKNLELLKQKDVYPYEYMDSFKRFGEEKLPDIECFYISVKDGTTGDNGDKLNIIRLFDVQKKFGMNLTWTIWVIITIMIWKKMFCY